MKKQWIIGRKEKGDSDQSSLRNQLFDSKEAAEKFIALTQDRDPSSSIEWFVAEIIEKVSPMIPVVDISPVTVEEVIS